MLPTWPSLSKTHAKIPLNTKESITLQSRERNYTSNHVDLSFGLSCCNSNVLYIGRPCLLERAPNLAPNALVHYLDTVDTDTDTDTLERDIQSYNLKTNSAGAPRP